MKAVLTTANIVAPKRFAFWQDAVCDTFVELDCQALSERPFMGELTTIAVQDICFSTVRSRDHRVDRTAHRIRHGREELLLFNFMLSGSGLHIQDGREVRLGPGDFACYDSTRPYTLRFDDDFETLVLQIPRALMTKRIGRTEQLTARPVRSCTPMGTLVVNFLRQVAAMIPTMEPVTAHKMAEISLALITTALGELIASEDDGQSWNRTALAYRAKALIEQNLHDCELNTNKVAQSLHISARYLQDLFHAENTTVSDWIWSQRLERCRRDLADPLRAHENISQIAIAAGFTDFGHFSRRFKAAYSLSPREFRLAQCAAGQNVRAGK